MADQDIDKQLARELKKVRLKKSREIAEAIEEELEKETTEAKKPKKKKPEQRQPLTYTNPGAGAPMKGVKPGTGLTGGMGDRDKQWPSQTPGQQEQRAPQDPQPEQTPQQPEQAPDQPPQQPNQGTSQQPSKKTAGSPEQTSTQQPKQTGGQQEQTSPQTQDKTEAEKEKEDTHNKQTADNQPLGDISNRQKKATNKNQEKLGQMRQDSPAEGGRDELWKRKLRAATYKAKKKQLARKQSALAKKEKIEKGYKNIKRGVDGFKLITGALGSLGEIIFSAWAFIVVAHLEWFYSSLINPKYKLEAWKKILVIIADFIIATIILFIVTVIYIIGYVYIHLIESLITIPGVAWELLKAYIGGVK